MHQVVSQRRVRFIPLWIALRTRDWFRRDWAIQLPSVEVEPSATLRSTRRVSRRLHVRNNRTGAY